VSHFVKAGPDLEISNLSPDTSLNNDSQLIAESCVSEWIDELQARFSQFENFLGPKFHQDNGKRLHSWLNGMAVHILSAFLTLYIHVKTWTWSGNKLQGKSSVKHHFKPETILKLRSIWKSVPDLWVF